MQMMYNDYMKIGLLGCGNVGSALSFLLSDHEIICLAKDLNKPRPLNIYKVTDNPLEIIENKEIKVVVEAISDHDENLQISKKLIEQSLNNNKFVFTCNKRVVSKYINEFVSLAKKNNNRLYIESLVSCGEGFQPFGDKLTIENILSFNQHDIFCFRGGGPKETAHFLYKEIYDIIEKEKL
jgi:homoserine dehydrogenase